MFGRSHSPIQDAADTAGDTLGDVKTGATVGAIKGAAAGALSVLGSKASEAAQNVAGTRPTLSDVADTAGKKAEAARKRARSAAKNVDLEGKADATGGLLQLIGKRAGEMTQTAASGGLNVSIHPNDVPRLLRGLALVATGLGTLFAPGSSLDVSRADLDGHEITEQARQGIDTAAELTQQRIKDLVEVAKDTLSSLADALTEGIETAESTAQQRLDATEAALTQMTEQAADTTKQALPGAKKGGGVVRWLLWGVLVGGTAAFLSSPFSGPIGERIANIRRDLGFGGDEGDDSQYWPSPPQDASTATGSSTSAGGEQSSGFSKTESWKDAANTKENSDKA